MPAILTKNLTVENSIQGWRNLIHGWKCHPWMSFMDGEMSSMDGEMPSMDGEMSSMDVIHRWRNVIHGWRSVIHGWRNAIHGWKCHPWMSSIDDSSIRGYHPWMTSMDEDDRWWTWTEHMTACNKGWSIPNDGYILTTNIFDRKGGFCTYFYDPIVQLVPSMQN